ncbi:plakophilin-2 [Salarias fasciatus]|uniref:Plakophilin 2 n=1 Tax=Salarias fasciatus TaxID=181472 RepID=A0A672FRE8_SALFA|nr:plakophilin-2 [Salarias fasciatus]
MDEVFIKSALPAQDSFVLDDTSLALPTRSGPAASAKPDPSDRNLRVQQQVQLTLARKARKCVSNGGVHLQRSTAKSFEAADGFIPNTKVNGLSFSHRSLSTNYVQRPSRRVEVSPPPSPVLPRSRFNYSTYRQGMHTVPGPGHAHGLAHAAGTSQYGFLGSDSSFQRYAFSEAPHGARVNPSASARPPVRQRSFRQATGSQSVFTNAAFQRSGEYGSRMSQRQSFRGANGDVKLGSAPMEYDDDDDDGLAWLARLRRSGQRSTRLKSYPPSASSVEVRLEADASFQQIQAKNVTTLKSENKPPEMTLEKAVSLLTQDNEETLTSAASYIQNQCFLSAEAKKMVYYLRGIGKLLQLLNSDSEEVQRAASGALRNVVYQSSENKMEVKENDGLEVILHALSSSHDMETRRQLTGVLWNLSSHDVLKERLSRQTLSVLTRSVLVPSSGIYEGENPKHELLADADAFYNATGCLRNLSSAGPDVRRAMRECENLIDSLVYYTRGTVANRDTDDKSTENCTCILHNLSYHVESELPQHHSLDLRASQQRLEPQPKTVGCFSYRGARIAELPEKQRPLLEEKANPSGVEWLWSPITVRMYLSLVACSTRRCTQEAAIGALQNITAGNRALTEAIACTVVQRENGLQHIKKVLEEGQSEVKRSAVFLIRNLSRYQELQPDVATQVLPDVVRMLPGDTGEVTTSLCQILLNLSQSDVKHVKAIVNLGALPKIMSVANADNSRAGHAACVLLHAMWNHRDLHGALKKGGFKKSDFINTRTTKVVNSR